MTPPTGDLAEVLRGIAEDPTFLEHLRSDPKSALDSYDLSHTDRAQLDKRLRDGLGDPPDGGSPLFVCNESPSGLDSSVASSSSTAV